MCSVNTTTVHVELHMNSVCDMQTANIILIVISRFKHMVVSD